MKNITIPVSDKDHADFLAIAKEENRRPSDLAVLLFAKGVEYFFCDQDISTKKTQDEFTDEQVTQLSKNKELAKTEGWYQLSDLVQKQNGYIHIDEWKGTHRYNRETETYEDTLIEPLANSIRETVLKEVA